MYIHFILYIYFYFCITLSSTEINTNIFCEEIFHFMATSLQLTGTLNYSLYILINMRMYTLYMYVHTYMEVYKEHKYYLKMPT